jgi:phage host-nuclease inhibitor protein Gam
MNLHVKRTGRVGIPFKGRIYSAGWTADNTTLTVSWHHIEKSVQLRGFESDPARLAKMVLNEIIETVSPRSEKPRG